MIVEIILVRCGVLAIRIVGIIYTHVHIRVHAGIGIDGETPTGETGVTSGENFDAVDEAPDFAGADEAPSAPTEKVNEPENFVKSPEGEDVGKSNSGDYIEDEPGAKEADVDGTLLAITEIPIVGADGAEENAE